MAGKVSLQEAVYHARDVLNSGSPQELADWIFNTYGMTVKPVIVTVILGKFLEQEHVDRFERAATEMAQAAALEPPQDQPKQRKKKSVKIPDSSLNPAGQEIMVNNRKEIGPGCPKCGSGQYVFRGRRKADQLSGEDGPVMETKRCCRTCNYEWRTRTQERPGS